MVERAVQVQLQQIRRVIGPLACGSGCGVLEAKQREVIDKGIQETDGMLCRHGVVAPLRAQEGFVAVRAVDQTYASTKLPKSNKVSRASKPC
jgi:hypothetical protein